MKCHFIQMNSKFMLIKKNNHLLFIEYFGLIVSMDKNGILAYKFYNGSINANVYGGFLIELIKYLKGKELNIN